MVYIKQITRPFYPLAGCGNLLKWVSVFMIDKKVLTMKTRKHETF